MKRSISFFSIFLFGLLCAACTAEIKPSPTELPAAITSPDFTPTSEPSATPTLTATVTPTPTPLPPVFVREGTPPVQPVEPISVDNAYRIQELARWGYGAINEVEHSKDGQLMYVQTSIGVYAYHAGTLDEVWRYEVDAGASAFDVGSQYLVVGTYSGEIILLDPEDGREVYAWEAHADVVLDVEFSLNQSLIISGSEDNAVKLWQIKTGPTISLKFEKEFGWPVYDVFVVGDGEKVYGWFGMIDTKSGEVVDEFKSGYDFISLEHNLYIDYDEVRRLSDNSLLVKLNFREIEDYYEPLAYDLSNDGNVLAIGEEGQGDNSSVSLWSMTSGELITRLQSQSEVTYSVGHLAKPALRGGPGYQAIWSIQISSDDRRLVGTNSYGHIFVWDLKSMSLIRMINSGFQETLFSPDGNHLISYNTDEIAMFSLISGERTGGISEGWRGFNGWMVLRDKSLFFSPDSFCLANGSRFWDIKDGERVDLPWGEKTLGFTQDGQFVFTLQRQWQLAQRRIDNLALHREIMLEYPKGLEDNFFGELTWFEMYAWAISQNQKFVEAIAYDISKVIWDIDTGKVIGPKEEDTWQSAKYSSDDRYYVTQEDDSIVVSEKQPDGSYRKTYTIDSRGGFSFYSDQILTVYSFGTLGFFDLYKKSQIASFDMTGYDSYPMWIISPDMALVAIADSNEIHLWDLQNNTLLVKIEVDIADDNADFRDLTFSPDGRYMATSSWDGTVRLWGIVP